MNVGDYVMHKNGPFAATLVRITDIKQHSGTFTLCGVEFVQILPNGEVTCGGYGSGADISEYHPITDPLLIAASRHYEAARKAKEHACQQKSCEYDSQVWKAAMDAIREAKKNGE